jgi:fructokinase
VIDILAVGELLIDFTPNFNQAGLCFQMNAGGAPCNMLSMAQALGARTAFFGKVGNDQFGISLKKTLVDANINTEALLLSDEKPTTLAFVHLDEDGERSFSFYRKNCADTYLLEEEIPYHLIDMAKVIHFGSLSFTDNPSKSTVVKLLKYAKSKNKIISYDPNYRPNLWASQEEAIEGMVLGLEFADIIKVSVEEAELITGETNYKAAAIKLHNMGVGIVCITLGVDGSYYYHDGGSGHVEGFKSNVIDTTGAGDSFFGAVVSEVLKIGYENIDNISLEKTVRIGNVAASIVIENYGGIPSIPSHVLVEEKMNKYY